MKKRKKVGGHSGAADRVDARSSLWSFLRQGGIILFLLGVIVTLYIAWRNAADERDRVIVQLEIGRSKQKSLQKEMESGNLKLEIFRKAIDAAIPSEEKAWGQKHNLRKVQFYVVDDSEGSIPGALVCVTNAELVAEQGGLTSMVWVAPGERVSVTKAGYAKHEMVLDNVMIGNQLIYVKLRRLNHVE